ncbi:prepilin-type N-terminal cleavage/methylation domain-containing protein [Pseudomonas sp. NY15372]|uniref:type IV pilus modification PilV family protein n=1 Tax=Pseudomonas TaxID=286 RepID=UPI0018A92C74|nr:prepilin-type N-terminal cleavage/methylation domain-containing protein [Pseudomonas guariconensis]MBF8795225.1 prepilin-type N-terminal cleavage/methylation domain-containing protein [Pseudomonas monteilii]
MEARERGMTLLEVLLTIVVLALGLFAAAAQQMRGLQALDEARREAQAVFLAQGVLERSRAAGTLAPGEQDAWQARLVQLLGASAQGRVTGVGQGLVVEVHHAGRLLVSLQGKARP